jgi:outer membrane protein assembly factor BamB
MRKSLPFILLLCVSCNCAVAANDGWFQWRGPNRDNKSTETGLLKEWPEGGPKMLWSAEGLGKGYSTVAVSNALIYTTGMIGKDGFLFAWDLDGNLKWKADYGPEWNTSTPGTRCTPTIDNGCAYVISGKGAVSCFDAITGDKKWSVDAFKDFDGEYGRWGISESPLIDGDKIIFTVGGKKATMVALNKNNGQVVWASDSTGDKSSYSSPILFERGGARIIVTMLSDSVIFVDADSGKIMLRDAFADYQEKPKDINPPTPVYHDGCVYTTSGYDSGGAMYHVSPDGKTITRKWTDTVLDNHHGGVILHDGYIYGANWKGNGDGDWVCLDWETGKVIYEHHWINKGTLIYADGMLYCYEEKRGTVALVKATPEKFEVTSSFSVPMGADQHWGHLVIYNGRLYIRHGDALMVYDIKAG